MPINATNRFHLFYGRCSWVRMAIENCNAGSSHVPSIRSSIQAHRAIAMNAVIRTLFFLSAFAPAVVIAAAAHAFRGLGSPELYGWLTAGALACVLPFLVIQAAYRQIEVLAFSAKKVESQDWLLIVFVVSYFVPLVTSLQDLSALALLTGVAAVLLATLDAVPCHPILHIFRFKFYKVEGVNGMVYILISRRKLLSAVDVKFVRQLSSQLLLEG